MQAAVAKNTSSQKCCSSVHHRSELGNTQEEYINMPAFAVVCLLMILVTVEYPGKKIRNLTNRSDKQELSAHQFGVILLRSALFVL